MSTVVATTYMVNLVLMLLQCTFLPSDGSDSAVVTFSPSSRGLLASIVSKVRNS